MKPNEVVMRHGRLFTFLLIAILTCSGLAASPAARADHGDKAGAAKGQHDEEPGGPQIFTPVRIDLAIWTLVVFLLLLFVLTKYAWNPMLGALQRREENIRGALDEAQRAREEAHKLREDLAQERAKIAEERQIALEEARRDGQQLRETMLSQGKAEIQSERDRLHREISTATDQALKKMWDQTAQLATQVSAKAIRRELSPDDHRRLVDEALVDLRNASATRHA
jgi:F-type H+-transporting ATPase subunit b